MIRTALVQGASRGLGLEIAKQLAVTHDRVIATCRCPAEARALAELAATRPAVAVLRLDVTDEASIARAAAAAATLVPHLDLVLNAAGLLHAPDHKPERRLLDVGAAGLERSFAVNARVSRRTHSNFGDVVPNIRRLVDQASKIPQKSAHKIFQYCREETPKI